MAGYVDLRDKKRVVTFVSLAHSATQPYPARESIEARGKALRFIVQTGQAPPGRATPTRT